ncbi:tyrosine-type recombinase/integrase [Rathayibacter sp. VKM Ac-2630]|uniref:tyrosine-type recombinase/integrase n=1 Tax=Rathayibacter sp. VKM Ac-2630 TaxID=1938617 RepID=UPI0009C887F7|nr:tyrosine-type recombinase/integrase [Rathayibacter sp. VKM Ac-2630]OOB90327.1 hypothetical protein B0T42_12580 [Rathayibacter sp. VKM Ac-2630]
MASVTPRRNRDGTTSWRVQFRMGTPPKMKQETFAEEKAARSFGALLDRVGAESALAVLRSRNTNLDAPSLREWTGRYLDLESGILTGIQPGTRVGYRSIAEKSFLPVLGELPVDAITKADVGRWIAWQESQESGRTKGQPISAKTVKNYHSLLSAILSAAVEHKLMADNPAHKARLTRGRKYEATFLSRQEFATLLHFVPEYYKPLVNFLAGTGARWGEATALLRSDVTLDSTPPTVRIDKAWKKGNVIGPPKSPKSRRTVSLWPAMIAALPLDGPGNEFLFQGRNNGGRLWYGSFKTRIWDRAVAAANDAERCAAAGLPTLGKRPNPHDLRHTQASWQIAAGTPLPFVQARLGHEKITTTVDTYGHLLPDAHRQMSATMEEAMGHVLPVIEPPLQLEAL